MLKSVEEGGSEGDRGGSWCRERVGNRLGDAALVFLLSFRRGRAHTREDFLMLDCTHGSKHRDGKTMKAAKG